MQVLVKGTLSPPDSGELEIAVDSSTFQNRCGKASLAIRGHLPDLFEQELRSVLDKREVSGALGESQLLNAFATYASLESFWECLPDTAATRLRSLIADRDIDALIESRVFDGGFPCDDECREHYASRLSELSIDEIEKIIGRDAPAEQFVNSCLVRLEKAPNFRSAESTMELLVKCMHELGVQGLSRMFTVLKGNDQALWASGIERQLEAMYEGLSPLSNELAVIWQAGVKELYDQIQIDSKERTWIDEALYRRLLCP